MNNAQGTAAMKGLLTLMNINDFTVPVPVFQWLVFAGLVLTLVLLLLILLLRPSQPNVVEKKPKYIGRQLINDLARQAREAGDEELQAAIHAYDIAYATNTREQYFFALFAYMDTALAAKYPEVKQETQSFKKELKEKTGFDIDEAVAEAAKNVRKGSTFNLRETI